MITMLLFFTLFLLRLYIYAKGYLNFFLLLTAFTEEYVS